MIVVFLMAVGTVFVFSAGANIGQELTIEQFYSSSSLRQLLFFPLAVIIMYSVSCINYRRLSVAASWFKSPTIYIFVLSLVLLVLVLIPGIGIEKNFARRWLELRAGPITISFQPSELAKWATIFFVAGYCDRFYETMGQFWKKFVPICAIVGMTAVLVVLEDFGTAALIVLLSLLILSIGGAKWWHLLAPMPIGAAGAFVAIMQSTARRGRILAFLEPEKWADTIAYQANQSLIAIGSGGIWGKGLGMGISKYGHLPEDTTDFIFSIIGEELGLVGTLAVILMFILLVWLGIVVIVRCKDRLGQLLASGIILAIAVQAALNIGVVTVVLPTKGIPLPFVSAGGTSMLLTAVAVGVLLNIAKQSTKTEEELDSIGDEQ